MVKAKPEEREINQLKSANGMGGQPYDSISEGYDKTRFGTIRGRIFNYFRSRILKNVLKVIPSQGVALDLACGTGLISEWLVENGYSVISGDISLGMLRVANRKLAKSKSFIGPSKLNACSLPFKDGAFDIVTSFRFLNLMPPDLRMKIHREVARVGKGPYLFTYALDSAYQRWRGRMKSRLGFSEGTDNYPSSVEGIKMELRNVGIDFVQGTSVCSLLTSELVVLASIRR
jgi:SAM-dependent methyltransferase